MNEEKCLIQQKISSLIDYIKDKQGQIQYCSCSLSSDIKNNIQISMTMSMLIDEYIILCKEYLSLQKQLKELEQ